MKKRILTLCLVAMLIIGMIPVTFAESTASYTDSNGVTYHLSAGKNFAVVIDASSVSGNITIASSVKIDNTNYEVREIADNAFYGSSATSITLPSTITYVGDQAFAFCPGLTSVNFGGASATLGNKLFTGSTYLANVTNYANIEKVGYTVFDFTQWYEGVKSESEDCAVYFGKVLLTFCGDASEFEIDENAVSIAPEAFKANESLYFVDLSNITSIGMSAFEDCSYLCDIIWGENIEEIGAYAFDGCWDMYLDLTLPASLKKIGAGAFADSGVCSVDLSATSVESIGNGAFRMCQYLEEVKLPDATTSIGNYAFEKCAYLNKVSANGVLNVGYDAFRGCENLSEVTMSNVESIASGAFDGTTLYADANGNSFEIGKTFYKTEKTDASITVSNGIVSISPYAFYNLESTDLLALPTSLNNIGDNAFMSLTDGTIYVFSRNDSVYSQLKSLDGVTVYIPDGKTLNNDKVDVGYIKGILIESTPKKTSYNRNEALDTTGISIRLKTELNGRIKNINIDSIGYAPTYVYDFAESNVVTVDFCGFTSTFNVTLSGSAEETVIKGDVNGDKLVTSDDIILMRKYIAGLVSADSVNLKAAELNGIEGINSDDLIVLRKIVAGLITLD